MSISDNGAGLRIAFDSALAWLKARDADPLTEAVARMIARRVLRYTHPIMSEHELDAAVDLQWNESLWIESARDVIAVVLSVKTEGTANG